MKHLGDITKINGHEVPLVDVICGGSPCQDLSVAGKRAGLAGERSGLFMEQIRIIKEMREHDKSEQLRSGRTNDYIRPRYMVWENVPGAFSSNKGEDFRAVLEETAKVADENAVIPGPEINKGKWTPSGCIMGDGWSIAWRVHDAQFWGVPQRRKRISLVADFGGGAAPEILFERKSMSGDSETGRETGEGAAGAAGSGVEKAGGAISFQERAGKPGGGKGILIQEERTGALSTLNNQSVCAFEPGAASRVGGHVYENDVAGTVRANAGDNQQAIVYGISSDGSNAMRSDNPHSGIYEAETTRTLDNNGGNPACNQGGMIVLEGNGARPSHMGDGYVESDTMYTLNATEHHSVCYRKQGHPQNAEQGQGWEQTEVNDTLNAFDNGESRTPTVVIENHPQDSRVKISEDGMVQTLSGKMGTGGGNVPMVMEQGTYQQTTGSLCASGYDKLGTQEALNDMYVVQGSAWDGTQVSPTLTANNANGAQRMPDKDNFNAVIACTTEMTPKVDEKGTGFSLRSRDYKDPQVVTYGLDRAAFNQGANAQYNFAIDEEKIGCQVAKGPGAVCSSIVRRLTPMECERLQGFPDGWTDIGEWIDSKGKKHKDADSPRYKALGNSIALPFWEWMAERICKQYDREVTMASLFDGIGGFPLVFSRCGAKPIWASEIEEFPIAVTKKHFGEEEK